MWQLIEEKRDWYLQYMCNLLEAARADPILTFLVFLHLLECYTYCTRELRLAHVKHEAARADVIADVYISWFG